MYLVRSLRGVMFPSDLEGTRLENAWVEGYDPILEENQDRYLEDFWRWCEDTCVLKSVGYGGHTIYNFD